jgi:hypothetical protein
MGDQVMLVEHIVLVVVVSVAAVALLVLLGGIVFVQPFRQDLFAEATGSKMSFLGMTIQGAFGIVFIALLIITLIYSLGVSKDISESRAASMSPHITLSELPFNSETRSEALETIKKMRSIFNAPASERVVERVRALKYEDSYSESIRAMARERQGPWSAPRSLEAVLSVPDGIAPNAVRACPNLLNKQFEVGAYSGEEVLPSRVQITVTGTLSSGSDCEERHRITLGGKTFPQVHVSCSVIDNLLGKSAVTCDPDGKPGWSPGQPQRIRVLMSEVQS